MLYVTDFHKHCVQKLTLSGEFLHTTFGQQGSGEGQFICPRAIIVDSNNRVIVSDYGNDRIQIFNDIGGWVLSIDGRITDYGV